MSMKKPVIYTCLFVSSLVISSLLGGCSGTAITHKEDPWESWNRGALGFNDDFDNVIMEPMTKSYLLVTPEFVNNGLYNFFSNINDVGVTINDLLQLKVTQTGMDISRFLINSTAGVAGFIDVAEMIDLPKHNEDFGQTLGFWGVPSGNYLVVPFLGASSPREVIGVVGDALMNPLTYTFVFAGTGAALSAINAGAKAANMTTIDTDGVPSEKMVDRSFVNRYEFIKNNYQQRREHLVQDFNVPGEVEAMAEDTGNGQMEVGSENEKKHFQHVFISP